jgi:hypothetical protein
MTRYLLLLSTAGFAAACSGGYSTPGTGAAPTPAAPGAVAPAPTTKALQLVPGTMRYLVHQDVHIQQEYTGLPPTIDLRYGLYLTAAIAAPTDSLGFPTTFTVDSIKVDSGIQMPPQINLSAARGYRVTGRLSTTGEFTNPVSSDTGAAASLGNLLPRFRSFFPRLPAGGVRPGDTWTDSSTATDSPGGTTITSRSLNHRTATTWEDRGGTRALRLEGTGTYQFSGAGEQGGAPFTIEGSGAGTGWQLLAIDGRYLGGEARDSTMLTIELPMQGITIPRRQIARTTVTALPR